MACASSTTGRRPSRCSSDKIRASKRSSSMAGRGSSGPNWRLSPTIMPEQRAFWRFMRARLGLISSLYGCSRREDERRGAIGEPPSGLLLSARWPFRARWMTSKSPCSCRSARCCTSSRRAATTSPKCFSAGCSPAPGTALGGYYRSRPLLLTLGLSIDEALASTMMRVGSMSEGRDIGVVFNLPRRDGPCALPVCGGVGTQFTPAVGWAQALRYREEVLGDARCKRSIAVAHGGDASTATNGFWSALNIATTQRLPLLFFIEDNGYGISVPTELQTPGGNIAHNLSAFRGLRVLDGDGSDPLAAAELMREAVGGVRAGKGPALLRLTVPRLSGHSGQDTQTYKGAAVIAAERERDPWRKLRAQLVPAVLSAEAWDGEVERARAAVGGGARARREAQCAGSQARAPLRVHRDLGGRRRRDSGAGRLVGGRRVARARLGAGRAPRSAHQSRDRRAPHARARARGEPARRGVRRGCRPQGRRARRDARIAGKVRQSRACSTRACPRKASSDARWAWRRRGSCRYPRSSFASTRIPRRSS